MKTTKRTLRRTRPEKHLSPAEREARFAAVAAMVRARIDGRPGGGHPVGSSAHAISRGRALGIARRIAGRSGKS